jgi:predicted deacetylase
MSQSQQQQQQQQQQQTPLAIVTIHDACPFFSTRIFQFADDLEELDIKYNIALVPFFKEKQDLPRFPEFVDKIKSYKRCDIALHGLYHERRNGRFDDFHTITKAAAEEEICTGLEILHEIGIKPNVFVPPAWKLNNSSIEVLQKLGFDLAETQEKFVLLSHNVSKKIKVSKVLNWDSTGYPEKNAINIAKDERCFNLLIKQNPRIIRIALHPRDPHGALEEQKHMINRLIDIGYTMSTYRDLVPKLFEATILL